MQDLTPAPLFDPDPCSSVTPAPLCVDREGAYETLHEPPTADPHGGWCGGWGLETPGYPIRPHVRFTLLLHGNPSIWKYLSKAGHYPSLRLRHSMAALGHDEIVLCATLLRIHDPATASAVSNTKIKTRLLLRMHLRVRCCANNVSDQYAGAHSDPENPQLRRPLRSSRVRSSRPVLCLPGQHQGASPLANCH